MFDNRRGNQRKSGGGGGDAIHRLGRNIARHHELLATVLTGIAVARGALARTRITSCASLLLDSCNAPL